MARLTNPVAVAMRARYGRTRSVHRDRRAPKGGQINEHRGYLQEWEEAQEEREDELRRLQDQQDQQEDQEIS